MLRQSSIAAKIIRLCDEILKLGRKDGTVGDYQRDGGPCGGGGGLLGSVWDERWVALAEQFDNLAEKISYLVLAIDPTYPVKRFYQADQEPYIAKVPGGRVRMPDHERESERDHTRWLYPGKTEAEIDALLAKFVTSMENLETYRARSMYSKPQWPGAVMLETDGKGKRHLNFMSWPKTVCQFEERFKAVKTWAETHLTDEAADIPRTGVKAVGNRKALVTLPQESSGKAGGTVDTPSEALALAEEVDRLYWRGNNRGLFAEQIEKFKPEGAAYMAARRKAERAASNADKAIVKEHDEVAAGKAKRYLTDDSKRPSKKRLWGTVHRGNEAIQGWRLAKRDDPKWPDDPSLAWMFAHLAVFHDSCLTAKMPICYPVTKKPGPTWRSGDEGNKALFDAHLRVIPAERGNKSDLEELAGYLKIVFEHLEASETAATVGEPAVREAEPEITLSKEARALAALTDHPDWTDKQIATAAGCNVKSLYRMKRFKDAKALLKEGKGEMPRGSKSKEGDVEAREPDDGPSGSNSLTSQYR